MDKLEEKLSEVLRKEAERFESKPEEIEENREPVTWENGGID